MDIKIKPNCVHVVCQDGASVSLQASHYHYCHPREDDGPYTAIEAGFPSVNPPKSWESFAEGGGTLDENGQWQDTEPRWTETVYAYLPVTHVMEFLTEHGGVAHGQTPPMVMPTGEVVHYDIPAPAPSKAFKAIRPSGAPLERL
jgi:hypothetical protein